MAVLSSTLVMYIVVYVLSPSSGESQSNREDTISVSVELILCFVVLFNLYDDYCIAILNAQFVTEREEGKMCHYVCCVFK